MSSSTLRALLSLAAYVAIAAILLWPAPFGGEVLSTCAPFVARGPFPDAVRAAAPAGTPILSDPMQTFEPWQRYAADAFARTGSVPLWKDSNLCGEPLVGNAQSALFWPPNFVAMLLGAPPDSLAWLALLKFAIAGVGTFLLARHLGLSTLGAFLAGLVFAFGGFQVLYLTYPLTNVSVLLPWLVLCADRAALEPTPRRVASLALVAALQHLGGHPETAFHCQVVAALLVCVRATAIAGGVRRALLSRALLLPAAGLLLGALAAALQILPFLEYVPQSEVLRDRSRDAWSLRRVFPSAESLLVPLTLVVALISARRLTSATARPLPAALGLFAGCAALFVVARHDGLDYDPVIHLAPDWLGSHDSFRGFGNYVLANGGYAGAGLVLAVFGMFAAARRGVLRVAGVVLVLALLLAHGVPVLIGLLESLPVFDLSVNVRLDLVALLAAAVLAGLGLDALGVAGADDGRAVGQVRRRFLLAISALVLAALVAFPISIARGHNQPKELVGAVRAARPMPAAAVGRDDVGADRRVAVGWIAPGSAAEHAVLLFGRGRLWPLTLIPVPPDLRARTPGIADEEGPAYAFRAEVPRDVLAHGVPYRVLCTGSDGATWLSPLLDVPDGLPRWLVAASAPEGRKSLGEIAFFVTAVLLVAAGCSARDIALRRARVALVLVTVTSLLWFGWGFLPTVPREQFYPRSPFLDELGRLRPDGRHLVFQSGSLQMNAETGAFYHLMEPVGYDAMAPWRVSTVLRAATDDADLPVAQWRLPARLDVDRRLLGLMAVEAFAHSSSVAIRGEVLFHAEPDQVLTANEQFLPRARIVPHAVIEADDARALALLRQTTFDPATTVVLSKAPAETVPAVTPPTESGAGAVPAAPVPIELDESDRVVIDVKGNTGGYLVLADTFFPGWEATVDGDEREVLCANGAFRAVQVRPGDRSVAFEYRPASFRIGCLVSAVACLLTLVLAAVSGVAPGKR